MSRDIVKVRTHGFGPFLVFGLVGAGGVEGEVLEDFASVLVNDFDVPIGQGGIEFTAYAAETLSIELEPLTSS